MLKYYDYAIVFEEVPDEITLALNISNCPGMCDGCSEPWLLQDVGTELTTEELDKLIGLNPHITCVGFMGGDNDHEAVYELTKYIHDTYHTIKVAMYSGREYLNLKLAQVLDYYKIGRFIMPKQKDHPEEWWKEN